MDILKVIAHLLDYPNEQLAKHKGDIALVIGQAKEISPDHREDLLTVLNDIYDNDIMDAEERYTGLFEQGRSLSLHLFEHVHGESRDRGQAMVDLMAEYNQHGFEINSRELPDYIPMFLEFLSYRSDLEAREWLADVSHILALLGARLRERQSPYAHLFESLLLIAGRSEELDQTLKKVEGEEPDNTPEALDKEWEEIAVTFGVEDNQSCGTNQSHNGTPASGVPPYSNAAANDQPQPLRWKDTAAPTSPMPGGLPS